MIHTFDSANKSAWNNWNITTLHMLSDMETGFYFKNTTDLLFETEEFEIGKKMPHVKISMIPQIEIFIDKIVDNYFLFEWLPTKTRNLIL